MVSDMSDVTKQVAKPVGKPKGTPRPAGSGRAVGTPNKATGDARRAIADFVDGNTHRLQDWLDQIANGIPKLDPEGRQKYNEDGEPMWEVRPSPDRAFTLFQGVIEYHVPKLARSEITGADGGPVALAAVDLKGLSDAELRQMQSLLSKANG